MLKMRKQDLLKRIGMPIKFSETKVEDTKESPTFGQHTKQILLDYGFEGDEIDSLTVKNVIK